MDGISPITWTTSCSSFLLERIPPTSRTSSIKPLQQWVYPKLLKRTRTDTWSLTSVSNSIPSTWRSVSLSTKSSALFAQSSTSLTHRPFRWHRWKRSSAFCPTAVKSSPLADHSCGVCFPSYGAKNPDTDSCVHGYRHQHGRILNGGSTSFPHGPPFPLSV